MKLFPLVAALATVLAGCGTPSYYVMRHLHKATGQDPGLTEEGRACAARLAEDLGNKGIDAIYVSTARRAQETAAPLAARRGLTPHLYNAADTPGLVARVRAEPDSVLIVGHSDTVPDIVEQLGGTRPTPLVETQFGDLWQISRRDGATTARRISGC